MIRLARHSVAWNDRAKCGLVVFCEGDPAVVWAQYFNVDGQLLGQRFRVSTEGSFCAWAMVAASGSDESFAITYLAFDNGANTRWLRKVNDVTVSEPIRVVDTGGASTFTERCGIVWTPWAWFVGTALMAGDVRVPVVAKVPHGGAPVQLMALAGADSFRGGPVLAYHDGVVCAFGFGRAWVQMLDPVTLTTVGAFRELDASGDKCEDHEVTWTGKAFLCHWSRPGLRVLREVTRTATGDPIITPSEGTNTLACHPALGRTLIVGKGEEASLAAEQWPTAAPGARDTLRLALWDGRVPEYAQSICVIPGGWVVAADYSPQAGGGRLLPVRGGDQPLRALNPEVPLPGPQPPADPPKPPKPGPTPIPPAEPAPPKITAVLASTGGGDAPLSVQFQAVISGGETVGVTWKRWLDPSRTVPEGTLPSSERPVFVLAEPGLWSVSATVDDVGGETTVVATVIVTKHAEKPAPPPAPDWRKILGGLFRKLLRRS